MPRKGRGAREQSIPLFEDRAREDRRRLVARGCAPLTTSVTHETARSIITHNRSPDIPFELLSTPTGAVNMAASIAMHARPRLHGIVTGNGLRDPPFAKSDAAALLRRN